MGRTVLLGHPGVSWREWIKTNRKKRDLLCLDPADVVLGHPAKFSLWRGDKIVTEKFYGSSDMQRSPHVWISAIAEALPHLSPEALIQFPLYRPTPVSWQTLLTGLQLIQPDEILVAEGTNIDLNAFPIGPEVVECEKSFPAMVQQAQRKAQWMALRERCEPHSLNLRTLSIEGARFGSGRRLDPMERARLGLESAYVEVISGTLLIVSAEEYEEGQIARALDFAHCNKAHFVDPAWYEGLICSFAKQSGEDFGFGFVQSIDFENLTAEVLNTAQPPAPVRILRLGSLRIDAKSNELPELRPWQV